MSQPWNGGVMKPRNPTIVWLDIEATHADPALAIPIQIAAIATDRITMQEHGRFEVKIKFKEDLADPEALEHNCYDPELWDKEARAPFVALRAFSWFLKEHATWTRLSKAKQRYYTTTEIGGHNILMYDIPVFHRWYRSYEEYFPCASWTSGPVDTMQWSRTLEFQRGERWTGGFGLEALCKKFKIELHSHHNALEDVLVTIELAKKLRWM